MELWGGGGGHMVLRPLWGRQGQGDERMLSSSALAELWVKLLGCSAKGLTPGLSNRYSGPQEDS